MIKIGADPEFFVRRGFHILPAHPVGCGSKEHPKETPHGHIQIDGLALECNVRPATTRDDFVRNVQGVRRDAEQELYMWDPTATLIAAPSIFFGQTRLSRLPPQFRELGCRPDMNAYTLQENPPPDSSQAFRTGAGHLHIGWTEGADQHPAFVRQCAEVARELDYYLGLPSLLWDTDQRRRSLYGRAGAFRPKPYGMEYRVLSNKWVSTDTHIGWVFDAARRAAERVLRGDPWRLSLRYSDTAERIINSGDTEWPQTFTRLAEEVLQ